MTHVGHNIQASTLPHTSRRPNAADIEEAPPQRQCNHYSSNSNGSSNSNSNDYANDSSNTNHCKWCTDLHNDVTIISKYNANSPQLYVLLAPPLMRNSTTWGFCNRHKKPGKNQFFSPGHQFRRPKSQLSAALFQQKHQVFGSSTAEVEPPLPNIHLNTNKNGRDAYILKAIAVQIKFSATTLGVGDFVLKDN